MSIVDIAIVGAGPAGLSAALYAARFRRSTLVLHDDAARAARIPLTHNVPGFDSGIRGAVLLDRMTRHAAKFGARFERARITAVAFTDDRFELCGAGGAAWSARALILATGVELNQIPLDDATHEAAIAAGVLRYCPVCDGFEQCDARIAVVGCDASGAGEALFLRRYSRDVTLLPSREVELSAAERQELEAAGVRVLTKAIAGYAPAAGAMQVYLLGEASPLRFDIVFPALGIRPRNELARALGLKVDEVGNVCAAAPFETIRPGLFCAGDLVEGLHQISVAMGHGAIAATKAHNWLRERDGHTAATVIGVDAAGGRVDRARQRRGLPKRQEPAR